MNIIQLFQKPISRLIISAFLFSTAIGIDAVTFPTILLKNGFDPLRIGIASSFEIISGIIMSLFLAVIVGKFGLKKLLPITAYIYAIAILIIFFCSNFYFWLLIIFIMGSCWVLYAIMRQAWSHSLIKDSNRGVITGAYSMTISIGLAAGPAIVKFSGADNYLSFIISAIFVLLSLVILNISKNSINLKISDEEIPLLTFFKNNPRCFLGRFFFDFQSFALISFSVVFGKKIGLSPEDAGLLITAFMSSFFFDLLVGFMLKKHSPYKLINIGFVGFLICILTVGIFYESYKILIATYFIMGIFAACIYVAVITVANNDYKKANLIAANSTMQVVGSIGALCGGLIGGFLIQIFDAKGFIITITFSSLSYLIFLVIYEKRKNSSRS